MSTPPDLLASARSVFGVAERDLERGLAESACLTAHRAAAMATQAWLEARGQAWVSDRVAENVALSTSAGEEIRRAAALLDGHRSDPADPAASGATTADSERARRVVEAGRRVVEFAAERLSGEGSR